MFAARRSSASRTKSIRSSGISIDAPPGNRTDADRRAMISIAMNVVSWPRCRCGPQFLRPTAAASTATPKRTSAPACRTHPPSGQSIHTDQVVVATRPASSDPNLVPCNPCFGEGKNPEAEAIRGCKVWLVCLHDEAAQSLRHGDHPLPRGHRGNDAIDKSAAVCAIRRPLHAGQTPRSLHEKHLRDPCRLRYAAIRRQACRSLPQVSTGLPTLKSSSPNARSVFRWARRTPGISTAHVRYLR